MYLLLIVITLLLSIETSAYTIKDICQPETLSLKCNWSIRSVLIIHSVRLSEGCNDTPPPRYESCTSPGELESDVRRACEGNVDCSLHSELWHLGCHGNASRIQVDYSCEVCENNNSTECETITNLDQCAVNRTLLTTCLKKCTECTFDHTTYTKTICEAREEQIQCYQQPSSGDVQFVLEVTSAQYGRTSAYVCPHAAIINSNCTAPSPLSIIKGVCDGRRLCNVAADNNLMTDPCHGSFKYLSLRYRCRACKNEHPNITECELWKQQGKCSRDSDMMASLCFASCSNCEFNECKYGNVDCDYWAMRGYCSQRYMLKNCTTSCKNCITNIRLHNHLDTEVKQTMACDGSIIHLSCASSVSTHTYVYVTSVFYGRNNTKTCNSAASKLDVNTVNCTIGAALHNVQQICNGFSTCQLQLPLSSIHDECPATHKYMDISYECKVMSECNVTCGENGWCENGACTCRDYYYGDGCDLFTCNTTCAENSRCVTPNRCGCLEGYSGSSCQTAECSQRNHCNGRGTCVSLNRCACGGYYTGDDCDECLQSFSTIGDSCLPCVPCKHGVCTTSNDSLVTAHIGCFKLPANMDEFKLQANVSPLVISSCMRRCHLQNYLYAALSDGTNCLCGNTYEQLIYSSTCTLPCLDDELLVCGGNGSASIWKVSTGRCECDGDNFKGFLCDECANGFTGPKCRVNIGNSTEHMFTSDQMTIRLQLPWKHIYLNLDERESKLLSYDISNKLNLLYQTMTIMDDFYEGIIIRSIRKDGTTISVDYTILFNKELSMIILQEINCGILTRVVRSYYTILGSTITFSDELVSMCRLHVDFCNGGQIVYTHNEISCLCPSNSAGSRCDTYPSDIKVLISVASVVCFVIIILVVVSLFYMLLKKKNCCKPTKSQVAIVLDIKNGTYNELE